MTSLFGDEPDLLLPLPLEKDFLGGRLMPTGEPANKQAGLEQGGIPRYLVVLTSLGLPLEELRDQHAFQVVDFQAGWLGLFYREVESYLLGEGVGESL